MMMNIFNIFDPSTSQWMLSSNWISSLILMIITPLPFWTQPSRFSIIPLIISKFLFNEFKILINFSFSNLIMFISMFFIILLNNFMGLYPYIFTSTSHMSFCLSLSLPMWLGMMIFSIMKYFNNLLSHLMPQGTPIPLMPFMVIIESLSLIIRPITLAIRLTANMIAGHLLMSLLGSSGPMLNSWTLFIMIITQNLLMVLEMAVSIIQAYVFSILSTLYSSEI